MQIYILSASGNPLMPTERENHVKRLLDKGKARIISKVPYTVQLKYETAEITQPLYGGTDPGRTNIGEAVVNGKGEVVYKAHVTTRNKEIPGLMAERKQHRQASRRGERLRRKRRAKKNGTTKEFPEGRLIPGCKEPVMLKDIINTESRFANRRRPEKWIGPTVRQLVQTHVNAVNKIRKILPVSDWTMEYNSFAFMKLENGEIRGIDYQNGRLKNFKDKYEYVHSLQGGKCACCGKKIEHYHHLTPRSRGGSDTPENLIGLCMDCHMKVHSGGISLKEQGLKIEKDHPEDAVCIAMYGAETTGFSDNMNAYGIRQFRRHDRAITKAQKERTYYLDGKAVCKNRHKRTDQKGDSLEEFRAKHPSDVGRLTVKKSTRSYNNTKRDLPGMEVMYKGQRRIVKGNHNTRYMLFGVEGAGVPCSQCTVIRRNQGLVYM